MRRRSRRPRRSRRRWRPMSPSFEAAAPPPAAWPIEPQRSGTAARTVELWRYRRLLWFLAVRGVKESYEGMSLGIFWLFARPLLPILVGGFVFGALRAVKSDGVPYTLFF